MIYHIERHHEKLGWRKISFASGSRAYCEGYVDAFDSMYPSPPQRIVDKDGKVVRETPGRNKVKIN